MDRNCHLHQRALQAAQDSTKVLGMRRSVGLDAEHALARDACGDAALRAMRRSSPNRLPRSDMWEEGRKSGGK